MTDFNENININIEAQYESLKGLQQQLDEIQEQFKRMGQGHILKGFTKELEKSENPLKTFSDRVNETFNRLQTAKNEIKIAKESNVAPEFLKQLQKEKNSIARELRNIITTGQNSPAVKAQISSIKTQYAWHNIGKAVKSAGSAVSKFANWSQKIEKSSKKSSSHLEKLWGRIRNISIYRMIRTAIKWVTSGFREGLQNFAQYSDEVNQTVSQLNGSLKQIRNTMGIALASTLQALQPVIENVLSNIVEGINAFNLALAKMRGENVFYKAKKSVDDYAKSLKKANKLSFDAFEVLNGGDNGTNPKDMFEQAKVEENENKLSNFFERIFEFIKNISDAIGRIIDRLSQTDIFDKILTIAEKLAFAVSDVIISLLDSGAIDTILDVITEIWNIFSSIIKACATFISYLNKIGALKPILLGIAAAWLAVKVAAAAAAIASALAWVAQHPITGSIILAGALTAGALIAKNALDNAKGFENGGIPNKSELFYMNENGVPEALVNTGGSQTNVINIDQLSEGMRRGFVQAIYDTGLIDAMQTRLVVDGSSVNDNAFARAIFPALKTESRRRGGNQL